LYEVDLGAEGFEMLVFERKPGGPGLRQEYVLEEAHF
jgi:hypothetical protein